MIPIAGSLVNDGGKDFTYELKRLSTSDSKDDSEKEGLRMTLHGGVYQKREQRAVIEFLCDHNRTGLEDEWESQDKYEKGKSEKREDKKDGDKKEDDKDGDAGGFPERQLKKENAALIWEGYKRSPDDKVDTLFLTWHTKHACEKAADGGNGDGPAESTHWGFFTWMFMLSVFFPFLWFPGSSATCRAPTNIYSVKGSSCSPPPTSSLARGSTIIGTEPAAGICSRTAIPSAIFRICSRIGSGGC